MAVAGFTAFADREELARQLADDIATRLRDALDEEKRASLAVSGGSTPDLLFATLSRQQLDWDRVMIALVDERDVPITSARSNERLVRDNLMQNQAAAARFIDIIDAGERQELPPRFAALVLGMGSDGHTASWFPDSDELSAATDRGTEEEVVTVAADEARERRHTLTLPVVARAHFLALHIEGAEKHEVFTEAGKDGPADDFPIRHVLRHPDANLQVYWAP